MNSLNNKQNKDVQGAEMKRGNVARATIPLKLPGLNEFIKATKISRGKWNAGNEMKQRVQANITLFIRHLPEFQHPVRIKFIWQEINRRRDYDNICFAKKFILDALQNAGKIKNDNSKYVTGFIDEFTYGDTYCVKLEIEEM